MVGCAARGREAGPDPAGQVQAGTEPTLGQGPGTLGMPAGLVVSHQRWAVLLVQVCQEQAGP